ncbi:VOC family protein [Deinococcus peraridilitoris]|nr:VOC family protein [Deinococcus peraridilitoris]
MSVTPDMVGYVVRDMQATLDFYRQLGLPIPENAHLNPAGESEMHVEVTVSGYRLAWDDLALIRQLDSSWEEPRGRRISVAFKTDSPAEVDALYDKLTALGYSGHTPPYNAFWGQRYAVVYDPDGNTVDLFCAL